MCNRGMASSVFVELKPDEVRKNLKAIAVNHDCLSLGELLIEGSLMCAFSWPD